VPPGSAASASAHKRESPGAFTRAGLQHRAELVRSLPFAPNTGTPSRGPQHARARRPAKHQPREAVLTPVAGPSASARRFGHWRAAASALLHDIQCYTRSIAGTVCQISISAGGRRRTRPPSLPLGGGAHTRLQFARRVQRGRETLFAVRRLCLGLARPIVAAASSRAARCVSRRYGVTTRPVHQYLETN
jgi:hypothetical protein